jgi:hypothetical protein
MRSRRRLQLAGSAAALLLLLGVASASASKLSLSERSFRVVWSPMSIGIFPREATMRCPVTLEGSFHSATFAKVAGGAIGQVTRATSGACTGGALTILAATLPWTIAYRGFSGALPRITTVEFGEVGLSWQVNIGMSLCLFRSTAEQPAIEIARREAGGAIAGMAMDETTLVPPTGFGCEEESLGYSGTGTVTRPGSAGSISVSLI